MAIYTFATAKTEAQYRLGNRGDVSSGASSRLENWLNTACVQFAKCDIELPFLEDFEDVTLTSGISEYTTTVDFALPQIIGIRTARNQTSGQRMSWMNFDVYRSLASQASGPPVRWSRRGVIFVVDPKPNATTTVRLDYRKRPTASSLSNFDDEWFDVIIDLAVFIGWKALGEPEKAAATLRLLPAFVQRAIQEPLGQDVWEAQAGDRAALEPMFAY